MASIKYSICFIVLVYLFTSSQKKPVLFIIGDSTVATAKAENAIQGWGGKLNKYIDTSKIEIRNYAVSGTSSRTFKTGIVHDATLLKDGLWKGILEKIKPGDFVIMQFGHNDESPLQDTSRMRGSIKGIGDDSVIVKNHFIRKNETVYTYGHYLNAIVKDVKAHGATALICSPIPKNKWKNNLVVRNLDDYGKWANEIAKLNNIHFIDLNKKIANRYDKEGIEIVRAKYFVADGVHTTKLGAELNAFEVAKSLKRTKLKTYLNFKN